MPTIEKEKNKMHENSTLQYF